MSDVVLLLWLLVFLRVSASGAVLAATTAAAAPVQVKIGLAVALALSWAPALADASQKLLEQALAAPEPGWSIGWLALREAALGAAIGWLISLAVAPIRIAGAYLSQELGLTLGGIVSPLDQRPSDTLSQLFELLGLMSCLAMDLHHLVIAAIGRSLTLWPIAGGWFPSSPGWVARLVSGAERAGLELAAPIGVGLFLALVVMLLIIRSIPQVNQLSFGMPFRLLVGLLLLVLLLPDLLARFTAFVRNLPTV